MDRVQAYALIFNTLRTTCPQLNHAQAEVTAGALLDEMDGRNLLVLGAPRRWRVRVDDPDAQRAYVFEDIEACTAHAAAVEGARRTIREDPGATIPGQVGKLTAEQRAHMADGDAYDGLVAAVARFAIAEEIKAEEAA